MGSECGKQLYSRSSPRKPPDGDSSGEPNNGRGERMLICKQRQTPPPRFCSAARRIHNGRVVLMSQFEDPSGQASVDPYSDAYTQPVAQSRDQEINPRRSRSRSRERPASYNRASTPPKRPSHAPIVSYGDSSILDCLSSYSQAPNPCNVLGIFGLSIRTTERDLDDEFSRYGRVEKVVIVYDQRVSLADAPP